METVKAGFHLYNITYGMGVKHD